MYKNTDYINELQFFRLNITPLHKGSGNDVSYIRCWHILLSCTVNKLICVSVTLLWVTFSAIFTAG